MKQNAHFTFEKIGDEGPDQREVQCTTNSRRDDDTEKQESNGGGFEFDFSGFDAKKDEPKKSFEF